MNWQDYSDIEFIDMIKVAGGIRALSRELNCTHSTIQHQMKKRGLKGVDISAVKADILPDALPPVEEIITRHKTSFKRLHAFRSASKSRKIKLDVDGPYGILHFGDPHLDDPGTDLAAIEKDIKLVESHPYLFAGVIGDLLNNWVGRLQHLHSRQEITQKEAWRLLEWYISRLEEHLIYLVKGNHDAWVGDGDPMNYLLPNASGAHDANLVEMEVISPLGSCTIAAAHFYPGKSIHNPAHAVMRAAKRGIHFDLLVAGHIHTSGYGLVKHPVVNKVSHCLQLASYKIHDSYQREKMLEDGHISPSAMTIHNPAAKSIAGKVVVVHDVEQGVEMLKGLRRSMGYEV